MSEPIIVGDLGPQDVPMVAIYAYRKGTLPTIDGYVGWVEGRASDAEHLMQQLLAEYPADLYHHDTHAWFCSAEWLR